MDEEEEGPGLSQVEYFDLYSSIKGMVGDRDVALAIFKEMSRDIRAARARREKGIRDRGPATRGQMAWLEKLGVGFGPAITYGEAQKLIEAELARMG